MGYEIIGAHPLRARGQRGAGVAVVAHDLARPARGVGKLRRIGRGVIVGIRSVIPVDLQLRPPLHRRPGIGRNHRDAAERRETRRQRRGRDLHDADDPRHLQRRARVIGFDRTAIDRGALDRGVVHPRQHHVDPVHRATVHDVVEIDDRHRLADEAPGGRGFQAHPARRRHRQARRIGGERTVAQACARTAAHDRAVVGMAGGGCHAPAARGGGNQHLPRRPAGLAHDAEQQAHALGSVSILVAVDGIARRLQHVHVLPVGIELVGQHLREAGADAGAHLRARHHDRDPVVGADGDEQVGHETAGRQAGRRRRRFRLGDRRIARHAQPEQHAARGEARQRPAPAQPVLAQPAPAQIDDPVHHAISAAMRMAALMRW